MAENQRLQQIYDALKQDGQFSQTKDYNTFAKRMNERGYSSQIWKNLKQAGADVGKNPWEMRRWLGIQEFAPKPKQPTAQTKPQTNQQQDSKPQTAAQMAKSMWGGQAQKDSTVPSTQPSTKPQQPRSAFVRGLYYQDDVIKANDANIDYSSPKAAKQMLGDNEIIRKRYRNYAADRIVNDEERRRNQPIAKTGTPADQSIVKTQGQLENEMAQSAQQMVNTDMGGYLDKVIGDEFKNAHARGLAARSAAGGGYTHGTAGADWWIAERAYQEQMDPQKMLEEVTGNVQRNIEATFSNPKVRKRVLDDAARLGVDPEQYLTQYVAPALVEKAGDQFDKTQLNRMMANGSLDYIASGILNSLMGTVLTGLTTTKGQRQMQQRADAMTEEGLNPNFQPGIIDKAVKGAVGFMADAPFFGVAGKVGGAVAGRVLGNGVAQAARLANMSKWQRAVYMAKTGAVSQGVTGILYGSTNAVAQNLSTGEDNSIGTILKLALKGGISEGASFATMGAIGGVVGGLGHGIGINGAESYAGQRMLHAGQKVGYEAFKVVSEGIGMHLGGQVANLIENGEFDVSIAGTIEDVANVVALKLTHIPKLNRMHGKDGKKESFVSAIGRNFASFITSDAAKNSAWKLSSDDKDALMASGDLKNVNAADIKSLSKSYEKIMADPNVSWDAKAKYSAMVMGVMPSTRPMGDYHTFTFEEVGGDKAGYKKYISEYSANGTLLSKKSYDTADERGNVLYQDTVLREAARMSNAFALSINADTSNRDLQAEFLRSKGFDENKPLDYHVNATLAAGMQDHDSAIYQEFIDYAANHGETGRIVEAVATQNGMSKAELINAFQDKEPLKRTDAEQNACVELRRALEKSVFKEGEVHEEQSHLEGKDVAEDNNLGTEQPKGDAVKQELNNLTEAENALEQLIKDNDVFGQNFKNLQDQGLTNPQIYQWMMDNGLTQEQLEPFARYINANARVQGMQQATAQKIEEKVSAYVQDWSLHGTLNGQEANGEQVVWVQDKEGRTLVVGSGEMAFDSTNGRAKEGVGDMLICLDPNTGEMVYVKAEDATLFQTQKPEDFGNEYRQKLQQINSQAYNEAAQEQAIMDETSNGERGAKNESSSTDAASASVSTSKSSISGEQSGSASHPNDVSVGKGTEKNPSGQENPIINDGNGGTDINGNIRNSDGSVYTEPVKTINDITDNDFNEPTRSVELPPVPKNVSTALGANGKPIIIKKNIFEKNLTHHAELEPEDSRAILENALYNPNLIGQTQPIKRPSYKVAVQTGDKNSIVVLDVYNDKKQVEIIGWRLINEKGLAKMKRQAEREGGQFLILSPKDGSAAALSALPHGLSSDGKDTNNSSNGNASEATLTFENGEKVPVDANGEPDFMQMTPEQGAEVYKMLFEEDAPKQIDEDIKTLEADLKQVRKTKFEGKTMMEKAASRKKVKEAIALAEEQVEKAKAIKKAMTAQKVAETVAKPSETGKVDEANMASPIVKERFDKSKKIKGRRGSITLADGTKITGTYYYGETSGLTPSHDPFNDFKQSEGFPVNEDGTSANSRAYKDKTSRLFTQKIGTDFNGLALKNVPFVQDGIVLSGNGTVMGKKLAEQAGKDGKYYEDLEDNAEGFGWTPGQIRESGFKGTVYFVPDKKLPLNSKTFDLFNKKETKSESNTEIAVANAKTLTSDEIGAIVAEIEGNGSLDAFFNNPNAINGLIKTLQEKGIIGQNEVAEMKDGEDRLSAQGKEYVKNLLLGSIFKPDTIRMLGIDSAVKNKAINGIRAIMDNMKLGDYSLRDEIDQAIQLLYEARQGRDKVDTLLRTEDLFNGNAADRYPSISQMMALALEGKVSDFRDLLDEYNRIAEARNTGEMDMFGERPTKEELVYQYLKFKEWQDYDTRHSETEGGNDVPGTEKPQQEASGGNEPAEEGGLSDGGNSLSLREKERKNLQSGQTQEGGRIGKSDLESRQESDLGGSRGQSLGDIQSREKQFEQSVEKLKTAEGEERTTILNDMASSIKDFAKEYGYDEPELHVTKEDFLKTARDEKEAAWMKKALDRGQNFPAYYEKGKVHIYVEGSLGIDDLKKSFNHESVHKDNAEDPSRVETIIYAVKEGGEITYDDLLDAIYRVCGDLQYRNEAERLKFFDEDPIPMLADEALAHIVQEMYAEGEDVVSQITSNPTLQKLALDAYKFRENERRNKLYENRNQQPERSQGTSERTDGSVQSVREVGNGKPEDAAGRSAESSVRGVREADEDKPSSVGFTPKQIREHQASVDEKKKPKQDAGKSVIKGEKWNATGEPEKFKANRKKHADSHDVLWTIGNKSYGSTTGERDTIDALLEEYKEYAPLWNAYEKGEVLLSPNEAAILKAAIIESEKGAPKDPMKVLKKAAEEYKEEKLDAARKAYADAKASGDESEIKRTRDELKKALDETYKAQGMGLIRRRKEIAKEIGKAEAEKIDKPWKEMDGEERMAIAEKRPLTEDEIRNNTSEENRDLIEDAIDYLNGNHGFAQQLAYLKIYEDVRRRHENAAGDSRAEDGTQLAATDNGGGEGLELGTGREGGGTSGQLDRGTGDTATPGEQPGGANRKGEPDLPAGERGNSEGEGDTPGLGGLPAGDTERKRSGNDGGNGTTLRHDEGRGGGNGPAKKNARRKPAAKQGTTWRNRTEAEIKQEAKEAKAGLKAALAEMMKRGRGEASISLVGLNSKQIEYVPELMKAVKRYGMSLIDQGIFKVKDWMSNIREGIHDDMKAIGFSDKDIDDFIEEMWNSKMTMDGETHTISEWSSIYGNAQLRKKLGDELETKRQKQMEAEPVKVKVGDKKNIEETLPFLLPQQQEDVLKAETQFFGKEHTDRDHAYGKGYMFTNGTGTGKTYTGLGIAKRLAKQGKGRILFITPSQKKVSDWIKDGKNLGLDIRDLDTVAKEKGTTATTESGEGMVITTYANMRQNQKLLETEWDAVIYDESHRIMENKKGAETTGSMQHYMLSNRDENHCFHRLQTINKHYQKMRSGAEKFDELRNKEIERIQKEYKESHPSATTKDVANATQKMLPKGISDFAPADAATFPKLGKAYQNFVLARQYYYDNVEPKLKEQAKNTWKNTKTVFLSATPFNTRENLDYAEGYIFKFPEDDPNSQISGRSRFYLDHFGAAYRFRYNRLEAKTDNSDAVAKQEIAFSDYLQHTLGTMSGRIIDSPYDYSRDFPTVAPDHAEDFNNATQDAISGRYLGEAYRKTIGDYNYGSALFETMKTANIIQRMKDHLAAGRKIVVFHRRVETKEPLQPPFAYMLSYANTIIKDMKPGKEKEEAIAEANEFRRKYADLLQWEQTLDYSMPREQIAKVFGVDNVLFFSGKESKGAKNKAVDTFNDDNSGKNIIVIQEASGKEGISLHDVTGNHQRVLITLGLPQSPITALQIEGRTYRIGNKSNAIFEYPVLGLNSEMMLFGQKFNNQVSTTENLALGSQARNLRDSFANGILEHSGIIPIDQQGVGGKEFDAPKESATDPFNDAVLDYYSNQKLNKKNREGVDYFPTPEPLGYKMMEWANLGEGDSVLEPSAGHGAIARYAPKSNELVSIEPSQSLFTKLQLKAGGLGRKFLNNVFENYDVGNKHDVVAMNPPFGTAGATAIAHLDKAFKHLDEGGRVVAIIPRGSTDKKFDKWYDGQKNIAMRAEVNLPDIVFQQAGTSVRCRVVVLDKITDEALRSKAGYPEKIDLGGHYDKIEDFFEDLRDVQIPDRIVDTQLKAMKKAKPFKKELEGIKGIKVNYIDKNGISVFDKNRYSDYSITFSSDNHSKEWLQDKYAAKYQSFDREQNGVYSESSKAALEEMKKLACKLADMSEDEMKKYITDKQNGGTHFREDREGSNNTSSPVESHIANVAEKVGGKVKMVSSVDEITNKYAKLAIEAGKPVTGWYDEATGEVHLYMPNIHDRYTAEKTIWHEVVGHKGMRELLGKNYDKFLRDVWYDLDKPENASLKKLVDEERKYNPLNIYDAIEEGIARLAEEGRGDAGFWRNIKNKVSDFLHEIGYRIAPNTKDVKYLLWLSKNLQKNPNDPYWKLRAEAVKYRLDHEDVPSVIEHDGLFYNNDGKIRNMENLPKAEWNEATDGEVHFRTTPSTGTALDRYHKALNAHGYMFTESYMDNMLSVKNLMTAIMPGVKIEDIASSENPYILQNTMQGAMSDAAQMFERNVMEPLDKAMADVLDAFDGKKDDDKIRNFNLYMIAKHGLERNRVFFVRDYINELRKDETTKQDADILQKQWDAEKKDLGDKLRNGDIDLKEYYNQMDEFIRNNVDKDYDASEHDYSGFHGLQEIDNKKDPYDDAEAIQSVMDSEAKMEDIKEGSVKDFWSKVHAATSFGLYTDYKGGSQDRKTYTKTSQMFDWYVPLRKFDETTAEDTYGYISENGDPSDFIGSVLMSAKGRKSLSETNILAQIGAMGNAAIYRAGNNAIKQAFMRFARSHDSQGLITESKVWLVKDGTNADGSDRWVETYPQIPNDAAPKTVSNIVSKFEASMIAKKATGDAKVLRNKADVGFRFERAKDKSQHAVDVMVNGKTHRFYINGNPRAAQALNGLLEHKNETIGGKILGKISRFMAQTCTSYNPEFVMRNMIRDFEFATSNLLAKEGVRYTGVFEKYYAKVGIIEGIRNSKLSDFKDTGGFGLFAKYRNGTLDMNDKVQRYFKEFMENGGETGWVQVKNMKDLTEEYKRNIKTERNKATKIGKGFYNAIFKNLENVNEIAENMARFSTYCASRDYGRSVVRSVYDAKEVSTNFNRHGSGSEIKSFKNGEMGGFQNFRKQTYRFTSAWFRNTSMFFNAGIQSTNLLVKNLKNNTAGTLGYVASGPMIAGMAMALLNNFLIAGEDEKDRKGVKDPYGELPDYIRRNNLCVYVGGGEFVTIPLAIEERAFYGLGDLAAGLTFSSNISGQKNPFMDAVGCVSQLVPVADYLGNASFGKHPAQETLKAVLPSATSPFYEWAINSDWKGAPIERDNKFDENQPSWMLAYKGTPDFLIKLNKKANAWSNDVAPGNEDMKGNDFLDAITNPSGLQHFYSSYLGGAATFAERAIGLVKHGKDTETKDIPFVRSLLYTPSEQSSMQRTKSKWYNYKDEMEKTKANVGRLKSKNVPIEKRWANIGDYYNFQNSNDAAKVRVIELAEKQMKTWKKLRDNASDTQSVNFANQNIDRIMMEAVEQLDKLN